NPFTGYTSLRLQLDRERALEKLIDSEHRYPRVLFFLLEEDGTAIAQTKKVSEATLGQRSTADGVGISMCNILKTVAKCPTGASESFLGQSRTNVFAYSSFICG